MKGLGGGASWATGPTGGGGPEREVNIGATSGYGARTRLPYVDVVLEEKGTPGVRFQISPAEARRVGLILLECAEAAEQDANLVRFLMGTIGVELPQAAQVLREFRVLREQRRRQETGGEGAG